MPVALFTHEKIRKNKELMIGLTAIKWLLGSEDSPLGISMMTHRVLSTKKYIYYFSHFDEKKKNKLWQKQLEELGVYLTHRLTM